MKRPLVPVVLAYTAGVLAGDSIYVPLVWLFGAAFSLLAAALIFPRARSWLFLSMLFAVGWTNLVCQTRAISPVDLRRICGPEPALVTLAGNLVRTPERRAYTSDDGLTRSRSLSVLRVDSIQTNGAGWQAACGEVLVLTPGDLPGDFRKAQMVKVAGVLARPPGPAAPGLFDYASYLRRQNIHFQLRAGLEDWSKAGPTVSEPYEDAFISWARKVLARGLGEEDESLRLLWSMALGWRAAVEGEVYEPFMKTGTMHIFAISGLHIAFMSGILVAIFRVARVPRAGCGLIVLPLIWFYTGATGWQPSAVRATVMMSIIIVGWAVARPSDLVNSLCAAAFLILLGDPQQVFGASFQLSFFVVLSIGLFVPVIERWRDKALEHDPMLPEDLVPVWRRRWTRLARWSSTAVVVSVAACLGSLPLCAWYFHIASPVTLLANVLIVPMSSLALACNLGSFVCGNWLWPFTEAFNNCAWFLMKGMVWLSDTWVALPFGYYYVRGFTTAECVIYYGVLVGLGSGWLLREKVRRWAIWGLLAAVAGLGWWERAGAHPTITVLPVDGGLAVHAMSGSGTSLIDCGKTNSVERLLRPFLRSRGVNRVSRLVLTHGDIRHVGGGLALAQEFRVGEVCASDVRFRSRVYRRAIEEFETHPGLVHRLTLGDQAGEWHVLHPAAEDKFSRGDDGALVLMGSFDGVRVLLLSDLGREGQEALLARVADLRADIVITGLPSEGEPLCDALMEKAAPQLVIVGDSETPSQERAREPLLKRLGRHGVPVISTAKSGVTTLVLQKDGWEAATMSGTKVSAREPVISGRDRKTASSH